MIKLWMILASLIFFSCNALVTGDKESLYIPINTGNKWSYNYDQELNPKSISFTINSLTENGGKVNAVFNRFPCLGFYDVTALIVLKENGSYTLDFTHGEDFTFIPPADKINKGYKWKSGEWNCSIENVSEGVNISGKNYSDCLHINYSNSITFWGEMWIKKGVGIVKWAFNRTNPPTTELGYYELEEYIVK